MDPQLAREKLESLGRCVQRIEQTRVGSAEALVDSIDAQDILTLNLTRAVQLCADLAVLLLTYSGRVAPASMGDAMRELADADIVSPDLAQRMRAAFGFRYLAVHAYRDIDWAIVHRLAYEGVEDLRDFARAVARHLDDEAAHQDA